MLVNDAPRNPEELTGERPLDSSVSSGKSLVINISLFILHVHTFTPTYNKVLASREPLVSVHRGPSSGP